MSNPAKRLHAILSEALKFPDGRNSSQVWREVLGAGDNHALLHYRLGQVMGLTQQAQNRLKLLDDLDVEALTPWSRTLNNAFSRYSLSRNWDEFKGAIDKSTLDMIYSTSALLNARYPEVYLSESSIQSLDSRVEEILQEIDSGDLSIDLKEFIKNTLLKIKIAIDESRISGHEPIVEMASSSVGRLATNQGLQKQSANSGVAKKFWEAMYQVMVITSVVSNISSLGSDVMKLLLPDDSESPVSESQLSQSSDAKSDSGAN